MNAETSDRRNSRLTLELLILSTFENHCNRVRKFEVSELPIHVGTLDRRNFRLMSELPTLSTFKNSCWPLVIHTGHVRYDLDRELSKLFKLRVVGTPDHCRNFRPSELPTYVGTPDEPTREQHFYSYWANTGHVRYEYRTRSVLPDQQK